MTMYKHDGKHLSISADSNVGLYKYYTKNERLGNNMYFEKHGVDNTKQVTELVAKYVAERGIKYVVLATNNGFTAKEFHAVLPKDVKIVAVTHVMGMKENGVDDMSPEVRTELKEMGVELVTTTHVLSGVERALSRGFGGIYPTEVIAYTLRMFGAGVKVGVECATMALDCGAIPYGEEVVAIGGHGRGADTAIAILPAHAMRIFETQITEIICKPRSFPVKKEQPGARKF